VITVYVNGRLLVSATIKVPPNVLAGFTGSTGSYYDFHKVYNVVITP
jgi:hypothetical protein